MRDEESHLGGKLILFAGDDGVSKPMTAGIGIKWSFNREIRRAPDKGAFFDVEVAAIHVGWDFVIAIPGESSHLGVGVKAITARGIAD